MATINLQDAINAYQNRLNSGNKTESEDSSGGGGFADMVSSNFNDFKSKMQHSEAIASATLDNKASLSDLVTAVSEAEIALQTITTIRDKVISAYNDIMKMQV